MRIRSLSVLALALVVLLAATAVAVAQRTPTKRESAAIKQAVSTFIHKSGSPAAKNNKVTRIRVSTVNDHWALVTVNSKTVGSALALMKKTSKWSVKEFGTGGFSCLAPKAVLKDLHFGCVPDGR